MLPLVILALVAIIVLLVVIVVTRRVRPDLIAVRQEVKMGLGAPCVASSSSTLLYSNQNCDIGLTCDDSGFGTETGICKVSLGQPCSTLADCTADAHVCSFGVCAVKPYGGLGQPPDGILCDPGLTIASDGRCRKVVGTSCLMDNECVNNVCMDGVCIAPLPNGAFCDRDKECMDNKCNKTWLMGSCQVGGHPCVSEADCASGPCVKTDTRGICQDPMITIGSVGSVCNSVVPCDNGLRCTRDVDIPSSFGQCLPPILTWPSSSTCATGGVGCQQSMICKGGECVFRTPDPTSCIADTDCPIGAVCTNGVCEYGLEPARTGTPYKLWRWRLPDRGTVSEWEVVPITMVGSPTFVSVVRDNYATHYLIGDASTTTYLEDGETPVSVSVTYDYSAIAPVNVSNVSAVVETIKVAVAGGVAVMEILARTTYNGDSRLVLYQESINSSGSYTLLLPPESDLMSDTMSSGIVISQSHIDFPNVYLSGGGFRYTSLILSGVGTRQLVSAPTLVGTGSYYDQNAYLDGTSLTYGSNTVVISNIVNVFYNGANGVGVVGTSGNRFPYYYVQEKGYILPARVSDTAVMTIAPTVGPNDPYVYLVTP